VRTRDLSGAGLAVHDRRERATNQHFGVAHTDRDHFDHGPWRYGYGQPNGLKDALARLRKFGGRCCLGFQSAAQVSSTYGGDAQTIVENCGNTLILRCSASEHGGTSQFASRLIGDREVLRRQVSRGSDREGLFARRGARRSKNTSEQRVTEAAVLASEIEGLPDFCGYLKVASTSEWLKVRFERSRSSDRSGMHGRLRLESRDQRPFQ
jgi:Type IV secretion-system coupling protein DNA-binding domain